MAKIILKNIKKRAGKEIRNSKNLKELDEVFKQYLGKKGELSQILRSLKKIPKTRRVKMGKEANELKDFLRASIEKKTRKIKEKALKSVEKGEWIDVTIPAKRPLFGHLHPLTQTRREVEKIFQLMGFSIVEGTEIETEWYNFDALNVPKDHPARDLWDTFYLKGGLLLRTHTSPVQIHYMEKHRPPIRIIVPGRIFRHEATDVSHEFNFYHVEGLMVDKAISAANFKAIIQEFFQRFFAKSVKTRMRPSYFPFVEPGFEVDMTCLVCRGKGCSTCGRTGWIEMLGAGMVHPSVFKNSGLNPKDWQGFAFGIGLERLAMMKCKINDIRLFYSGDLRFLNQF